MQSKNHIAYSAWVHVEDAILAVQTVRFFMDVDHSAESFTSDEAQFHRSSDGSTIASFGSDFTDEEAPSSAPAGIRSLAAGIESVGVPAPSVAAPPSIGSGRGSSGDNESSVAGSATQRHRSLHEAS
jgi:hypothetical protein